MKPGVFDQISLNFFYFFVVDNGWYRSQILDIPSPNQINVFYIDFGNCEIVDLSSVKTLAPAFYSTPAQAARCRLYGAEEKTWSESECEMFEGLVLEKDLIAEVKSLGEHSNNDDFFIYIYHCYNRVVFLFFSDGDETTLIVDLFDTSGTENVRIFDELVKKSSTTKATGQRNLLKLSSLPKLGLKDVEDVFVESAESLDYFVCQLSRFNNNIETLADMMYYTYHQETAPDFVSTPLQVDDVIAALYSEDETWYRASVSKHENDGDIEVMFLDYGNSEIIPKSEIGKRVRYLNDELSRFPPMRGLLCCMASIDDNGHHYSWTPRAHYSFVRYVVEKDFKARIMMGDEEPLSVILEDESESIYTWLARNNLMSRKQSEVDVEQDDFYELELETGTLCDVYVTWIKTPQ